MIAAIQSALRRRLSIVIACLVVVPAAAVAFSLRQEKQYSAGASLLFRDVGFDEKLFGSTFAAPAMDPAREAATNIKLISLKVVSERTARRFKNLTSAQIERRIELKSEPLTDVVEVIATTNAPELSAALATDYAQEYVRFRQAADREKIQDALDLLTNRLASLSGGGQSAQARSLQDRSEKLRVLASLQTGNAELVQPAEVPSSPSSPRPVRAGATGVMGGVVLAGLLVLLLNAVDRRIRSLEEVEELFARPIVGRIPWLRLAPRDKNGPRLAGFADLDPFRLLRASLRYFNPDRELRSVIVTSSSVGDGKSTIAANLAVASVSAGSRTLLIETDLRQPTVAKQFELDAVVGLADVLAGTRSWQEAVTVIPVAASGGDRSLHVLPAGPLPPNPTDLLESRRMSTVLAETRSAYDLVIIDTPPITVVADCIPLVPQVDGVIAVVRINRTHRGAARRLAALLHQSDVSLLGVCVNGVEPTSSYGGYGYQYAAVASTKDEPVPSAPSA